MMMSVDPTITHGKQRKVLKVVLREYGDHVDDVLNALLEIATRVAISDNIDPEIFAGGVKHHWDSLANAINARSETKPATPV